MFSGAHADIEIRPPPIHIAVKKIEQRIILRLPSFLEKSPGGIFPVVILPGCHRQCSCEL
jgi:hypothetical protein